jgi:hypothetical protein
MSREQRRTKGKTQPAAAAPPSRRTPVKVGGGSRIPLLPVAIGGGVVIIVALIAYLVTQTGGSSGLTGYLAAEADASSSIPGTFEPTQGRNHFPGSYVPGRVELPFCPGVAWSGDPSPPAVPTPVASPTPAPQSAQLTCHSTNPPTSGEHLNVQNNVDAGNGIVIKIPPDPDIYPPSVEVPRDAIPHILEHAGVFVGYNCASGDSACSSVIDKLTSLVTDRLQNGGDRIVMAHDNDLVPGTIGMAAWTRLYEFKYQDYNAKQAQQFMDKNSCRFDPEGFCH